MNQKFMKPSDAHVSAGLASSIEEQRLYRPLVAGAIPALNTKRKAASTVKLKVA